MVAPRRLSYASVGRAGREVRHWAPAALRRPSNCVLVMGLAACALLGLGWRPGPGRTRRRALELHQQPGAEVMVAATVAASAGVHGYVHKQGVADLRNWHPDYKAFRQERLAGWQAERQAALAEGERRRRRRLLPAHC